MNEQEVESADLESGYSDAPEPATAPEPVVAAPVAEDPTKALLDRIEKLEARTRNTEGHIGGLNHQQKVLQETLQAASKAASKVDDAPTQAQVTEAMANPAEWESLKGDFPEWASATEKLLEAKISRIPRAQPAVDPQIVARMEQTFDAKLDAARYEDALDALDATFEGWREYRLTPEFKKWQSEQTPEIQQLGDSRKFSDAAKMLRLYEKSKVKPEPAPDPKDQILTRQRRLQAAVTPRGSGGNDTARRTELDEMEEGYK